MLSILQNLWCNYIGPFLFCALILVIFVELPCFLLRLYMGGDSDYVPQSPDDPYEYYGGEYR